MKKKNLIILLIIPFLISLLGIITLNISINTFYGDITSIKWEYDDVEAFKLTDGKYLLKATALNASNAPLSNGNTLIWKCENVDEENEEQVAEIVYENSNYYLKPNTVGEVVVTCSNLKGNIFRKMNAIIYQDGVIIVTPKVASSQNNIDPNLYYGEYDLENGKKINATFEFNVKCIPNEISESLSISDQSDNLIINLDQRRITIAGVGQAYFSLSAGGLTPTTYSFNIVEDGVNVYDYDDLLNCTNKSEKGEIVVLHKSFESLEFINSYENENAELFGKVAKDNTFNFIDDVYRFDTNYNKEYIKQWNAFADDSNKYSSTTMQVIAGLHVQKDFYGNGYTINMHNLTYPSQKKNMDNVEIPLLGENDLFRGPLPFYTLGDPNGLPLVSAYGQDNIGMYVDGNDILINDVNLKNADIKGSLSFLDTVGTVLEANGSNITIKNSRLSNGKNILRCFSTPNFVLDNSLLSNSRNFLLEVGTNEYMTYDEVKKYTFKNSEGQEITTNIKEYLDTKDEYGDNDLNKYLMGNFTDSSSMRESLNSIQNALNDQSRVQGDYKTSLTIKDTYFYNSGIASIAMESMFNGPFLYSAKPSQIMDLFAKYGNTVEGKSIIPYTPTKVGGVSYPSKVDIIGNTKFFDYKDTSNIDITGLIKENISSIISQLPGDLIDKNTEINIDTIFPIKPLLLSKARSNNETYTSDNVEYINIPIAYYGGGLNLSEVNVENMNNSEVLGESFNIDFLDSYLTPSSNGGGLTMANMKSMILKCVTLVTGFEPFKFVCTKNHETFGETPDVQDLIKNAKGV